MGFFCRSGISITTDDDKCIELLKLIGLKLLRLKVLEIEGINSPLNEAFINGFKSIEKLILNDCYITENFEYLKNCVHLTHLSKLDEYLTDGSDFKDIHLYLPQIKSIDLMYNGFTEKQYLINLMKHLEKMQNLCELKIGCYEVKDEDNDYSGITTDDIISFIDKCLSIRRIGIYPKHANINITLIEEYIQRNNRKIIINTLYQK